MAEVDPVGGGGQLERSEGRGQHQRALDLRRDGRETGAPLPLLRNEPDGDALEAWPPESAQCGPTEERTKQPPAGSQQALDRIGGKLIGMLGHEAFERPMNPIAAVSGTGLGIKRIEGSEPENVAGID